MLKRVVVMAGGTGGHVFPALAVAHALEKQGIEVTWVGTQRGMESDLVPKAGFEIDYISIAGLRGNGLVGWLKAPFRLLIAATQAFKIIRNRNPDLVLGMGGFVTGPGGFVAWLCRKPLIIQEQNAIPGLTNRLLANFSKRVLEAFPNAFENRFKALTIGNPVRREFINIETPEKRFSQRQPDDRFRLLVIGGSLGALALNKAVPEAIKLLGGDKKIDVWHQAGKKHIDVTLEAYATAGVEGKVAPFIDDMSEAYQWADLVLCRSGALTVSEIAAIGVGSILVPYPYAVDDHQTVNAKFLVDAGAAQLMAQNELNPESLASLLKTLIEDRNKVVKMAEAAYQQRQSDSVEKVLEQCHEVCNV